MRTASNELMLPWTVERAEANRFKVIVGVLFALAILFSVWVSLVQLPEPDREELEKLPPQLAKLLVEKKVVKPPKPIVVEKVKTEAPKPEPVKKPRPKRDKPELVKPKVKPNKAALVKKARAVAKKSGLLALQSELADLKAPLDTSALKSKASKSKQSATIPSANTVDTQRVLTSSAGASNAAAVSSASANLNSLSKASLSETDDERALALAQAEAQLGERERSEESIRLGLEKLKQSLYKLYNRELRKDPFLEGVVVLEIVIEATGEVSYVRVVSSALNHKALEAKFVGRIKLASFGPENVSRTTRDVPFNFQPRK